MRDTYNRFIKRHEIAWELTMALLAIAFVVVGLASDEATGAMAGLIPAIDGVLTVIFVAEFTSRLFSARDRGTYLGGHWIDAVALIPTVRGFRLLRLLRLLRLVRAFAGLHRSLDRFESLLGHRDLATLFSIWLAVMLLGSAGLYTAEKGINATVNSPFDAVWWGVSTMTTVGYGDIYPITPEGRLAAMVLMILGVALVGLITGTLTTLLMTSTATHDPLDRLRTLAELRASGVVTEEEFAAKKTELLEEV